MKKLLLVGLLLFPFALKANPIAISVELHGKARTFVVDTGAETTAIPWNWADETTLDKVNVKGFNGTITTVKVGYVTLSIDGRVFAHTRVVLLSKGDQALLGRDVLDQYSDVEIDNVNKTVTLTD